MRNSSLVERSCAENVPGLKHNTEAEACVKFTWHLGRGAFLKGRSCTERSSGLLRRENAGMSSEMKVRILQAEYLRFPGVGSSALGKPGAKARPKGVVDAHTVEIP